MTHTDDPVCYAQTLLDVTKEYRRQQRICAVAMSRVNNVDRRIHAILDAERRRSSFTNRTSRLIGVVAIILTLLVGSLQLRLQADDQNKPQVVPSKDVVTDTSESRTMAIRVVDGHGKPIPQTNIYVSIWKFNKSNDFPNQNYKTDERGRVDIAIPRQL